MVSFRAEGVVSGGSFLPAPYAGTVTMQVETTAAAKQNKQNLRYLSKTLSNKRNLVFNRKPKSSDEESGNQGT